MTPMIYMIFMMFIDVRLILLKRLGFYMEIHLGKFIMIENTGTLIILISWEPGNTRKPIILIQF